MKTKGLVLEDRAYRTSVEPPDALEDVSRFKNDGVHTDITWVRLPSGLWVRSFNGTSSFVDCGNAVSLNPSNAITFMAWCNPSGGFDSRVLARDSGIAGDRYYAMHTTPANEIYCGAQNTADAGFDVRNYFYTAGQWIQVATTVKDPLIALYVNGNLIESDTFTGTLKQGDEKLIIGAWRDGIAMFFQGYIALVRIYNYALSAPEVYAHYQAERRFFGV